MEVIGILLQKTSEREGISQKNGAHWKFNEYLLEVPGAFPRHINFRVSDGQVGRVARFDSLIGKNVTVSFDIDAHKYEDRWFNELTAWGIMEYVSQTATTEQPAADTQSANANTQESVAKDDDLPF